MQSYFKFIPYIYLVASVFFLYTAIVRYTEKVESFWIWLVISGLCLFMFFFRRRFAKRFTDNPNQKK